MAIEFVRAAGSSGTSLSFNIGTAGTDRLVIVYVGDESETTTNATISVGTASKTHDELIINTTGLGNKLYIGHFTESELGSNSGTVTISSTQVDGGSAIHAHLYTGVADQGPVDTGFNNTDTSGTTTPVSGIAWATDDLVFMAGGQGTSGSVSGFDQGLTERQDGPNPSSAVLGSGSAIQGSAGSNQTVTITWTNSITTRATAWVGVWEPAAATVITMIADPGSFSWFGAVAGTLRSLMTSADPGAYSWSGTAAGGLRNLTSSADQGLLVWSGTEATLLIARQTAAEAGSVTWAGQQATTRKDSLLQADSGSYAWSGTDAQGLTGSRITAEAGSLSWTGTEAQTFRNYITSADAGAVSWVGSEASFPSDSDLQAGVGSLVWTGTAADFRRDRILQAQTGNVFWTGQSADTNVSGASQPIVMMATCGVIRFEGTDMGTAYLLESAVTGTQILRMPVGFS